MAKQSKKCEKNEKAQKLKLKQVSRNDSLSSIRCRSSLHTPQISSLPLFFHSLHVCLYSVFFIHSFASSLQTFLLLFMVTLTIQLFVSRPLRKVTLKVPESTPRMQL